MKWIGHHLIKALRAAVINKTTSSKGKESVLIEKEKEYV